MDPDTCQPLIENQCEINNGQLFFIMLSFIPLAIFVPLWTVAALIYAPWMRRNELKIEEEVIEIPYVEKYNLKKATNDNLKTLDCEKNFVMESTPDGVVLMSYNRVDEGFNYWADNDIKFQYLEVTARKYVEVYHCRDFYINQGEYMRDKIDKIESEIEENKKKIEMEENKTDEEKKKEADEKEDDVFATLKSNKTTKLNLKTKLTKDDFVPDVGTKFMKKGKIVDSMLNKKVESTQKVVNNMNFSAWKNAFGFGDTTTGKPKSDDMVDNTV
jgi:hypothetical protein